MAQHFIRQVHDCTVQRQTLAFVYGNSKCQDEWELLAVDVQFFEHSEPVFHPLICIGLGPSIKLGSDVVCFYCNHCTDCSVYQPTASADVPMEQWTMDNIYKNMLSEIDKLLTSPSATAKNGFSSF